MNNTVNFSIFNSSLLIKISTGVLVLSVFPLSCNTIQPDVLAPNSIQLNIQKFPINHYSKVHLKVPVPARRFYEPISVCSYLIRTSFPSSSFLIRNSLPASSLSQLHFLTPKRKEWLCPKNTMN